MEQIEQYMDEMYDNTKQFASILNELPTTSESNQENIMLQDIITKNEMATDNSMKLIETSLMEVSSKSPRVPPRIGWGIYQFSVPEG